jgi:hypothetical protein
MKTKRGVIRDTGEIDEWEFYPPFLSSSHHPCKIKFSLTSSRPVLFCLKNLWQNREFLRIEDKFSVEVWDKLRVYVRRGDV